MRLSVVVTIVDAGDALDRCLTALAAQQNPPVMEVIVPWDDTVPGIPAMASRFPAFQFLALGRLPTSKGADTAAGQHELFDRRRSGGLAAATGEIVAILEDRGVPRPAWARTLSQLHAEQPAAAIGGAVENGRDAIANWAVYFCDFGRYHLPLAEGPRDWITDVNIGYKRRALELTRELWRERYHETTVHWALQRAGEVLWLSPAPVVDQMRGQLRWRTLLGERYAWGRLFAYTRAREADTVRRVVLAASAPILPMLLLARHARVQLQKRATFGRFLMASPMIAILLAAWSLGETVGYITAEP